MIVCSPCKKEMTCVCTGKMVVFGGDHVYGGDEFRCGGCGATVVVTSKTPYHMADALTKGDQRKVLDMNETPTSPPPVSDFCAQRAAELRRDGWGCDIHVSDDENCGFDLDDPDL